MKGKALFLVLVSGLVLPLLNGCMFFGPYGHHSGGEGNPSYHHGGYREATQARGGCGYYGPAQPNTADQPADSHHPAN
ncbi:MAG: hypothetical protein HY730_06780 [Candidatus Tectomicrobia bacterium]|uniref:Uncharacterized protein n=1 Tax=Tectimicrobiota bacterium TaxID=2528274 RepID=A0A933GM07_UNCTE|nr:hypothetical protein [Candidatus Tectomicrobia bacterium]